MELTPVSSLLQKIREALVPLENSVFHYVAAPNSTPPYIVWSEDGDNDLLASNGHAERSITGTVDLYTKTENDPLIDSIPQALESAGVAWYFNSFQYETETGLLHFEWAWEVV